MQKKYNIYNIEAEFKRYLESNNFSRITINNYIADFRIFLSWYVLKLKSQQLEFDLSSLTASVVQAYQDDLMAKEMPVKTVLRYVSSLRTFIRFCIFEQIISGDQAENLKNIKLNQNTTIKYKYISRIKTFILFSLGFLSIILLFLLPGVFMAKGGSNSKQNEGLLGKNMTVDTNNATSSPSATFLNGTIFDSAGNINLSDPYPKIIGSNGTLSIEAPQLSLSSGDKGNMTLSVSDGSLQFLFEGLTPPLPYESAFYFSSKDITQGSLIRAQTVSTGSNLNLLELSSGLPAETKFKVDADGNVYIKGNVILEGNLIVNPSSNIFGNVSSRTATSSFSPEP